MAAQLREVTEIPEVYALTSKDVLMPGIVVSRDGDFYQVRPIGKGKAYTFHESRLMAPKDRDRLVAERRAAEVLRDYDWVVVAHATERKSGQKFDVVRCTNRKDISRSYLLYTNEVLTSCSCPSFQSSSSCICKHVAAWEQMTKKAAAVAQPTQPVAAED